MNPDPDDLKIRDKLAETAAVLMLDIAGGRIRRTSSRFCFGVEHGDYNGTELFGVGTDRFIWLAFKPNASGLVRIFSGNFPDEGAVTFRPGEVPAPQPGRESNAWARFPLGAAWTLTRAGFKLTRGFDAVLWGNIPGGGMSRSAALAINLILTIFEVNGIEIPDGMRVVELAQAVENDYIGSPCGQLDQIMIYFARAGMGAHFSPKERRVTHIPLGSGAIDFRIVSLDTGTIRPGLEKSTYRTRRAECEKLVGLANHEFGITALADVRTPELLDRILKRFAPSHPELCERLKYIYNAQQRFYRMLEAWQTGDVPTIGKLFRADGIGLRDEYKISGPELETMCDIARTVPGVLGERMLGGGDKGAAGAIVRAESVEALQTAVDTAYPRSHPDYASRYAVHACRMVDGVTEFDGLL